MDWLTSPAGWLAFATLLGLEVVLGIDNVVFISILVAKLPPAQQKTARRVGLGLAMFMPDPDNASVGDSKYAKNVRTHKILRWIHLTGMLAQIALGIVIANPGLGLERSSDYDTLQTLSRAHLGIGYATFAALTWAGTIMLL